VTTIYEEGDSPVSPLTFNGGARGAFSGHWLMGISLAVAWGNVPDRFVGLPHRWTTSQISLCEVPLGIYYSE
jgi:hypothetical protein